ncbi:hypothetical protein S245_037685 [Arachis hypogaea]
MEDVVSEYMWQFGREQYEAFLATKSAHSSIEDFLVRNNPMNSPGLVHRSSPNYEIWNGTGTLTGRLPDAVMTNSEDGSARNIDICLASSKLEAQTSILH